MRVMLMIKGDPETGAAPSEELLAAMAGEYGAEGEVEIRQVFELEGFDESN